jgi:hypothetical protein
MIIVSFRASTPNQIANVPSCNDFRIRLIILRESPNQGSRLSGFP